MELIATEAHGDNVTVGSGKTADPQPRKVFEEHKFDEEEEDEYEEVNCLQNWFYYLILCCQPKAIMKVKLPKHYKLKNTIAVDFGHDQFNSKKRNCLTRLGLFMKHHLEVYLKGFGFKNLQVKEYESDEIV